ncbi:MAG: hypothetical protein LLF75_13255 [Eubacteriales bacterium]|nr:hypothetical protein [Eubacteriales bacterium]
MALHKCPKCELNYIRDGEDFCEVCKRELKRAQARGRHTEEESEEDEIIMCTECGEAPAVRGSELCAACLREQKRQVELENATEISDVFPEVDEELEDEEIVSEEE